MIYLRNAHGYDEFLYPVAYDLWHPQHSRDTYARVTPQRGVVAGVEIVRLTDAEIADGGYREVSLYGDKSSGAAVWLSQETMLRHLQLIALALAKVDAFVE